MSVTLETLEMTCEDLQRAREAVRKLAYFKWLEAGCPNDCDRLCWVQAEQDWIAHNYVPDRSLDGNRPRVDKSWADSIAREHHEAEATETSQASAPHCAQDRAAHATA